MQSITTVHHNLTTQLSKGIVKSLIGSLNATAIAYARGHLRYNAVENIADRKAGEVPTIDDYNDAQNAVDEANFRDTTVADGMGFEVQMQSGELAEKLMLMRNWFAEFLNQHKATQNDVPLSIAETVKFQMSRPSQNNDDMIEALAAAVEIDAEMLKAAQIKMVTDDVADLKANAGKVITFLEGFDGSTLTEVEIESLFDTLPAHVQYKLMSAAIRAHDKATQKAMMSLLRGKLDAAGDIKMLKANRVNVIAWLATFSKVKRVALDAYLERGGMLQEFDDGTIITSNTKAEVKAPEPEQAPAAKAQAERSLRRAPRPAAVQ